MNIGEYIRICVQYISDIIVDIFQFFFNIFWTNGVLNIFGWFFLIIVSITLISVIIDIILGGGDND